MKYGLSEQNYVHNFSFFGWASDNSGTTSTLAGETSSQCFGFRADNSGTTSMFPVKEGRSITTGYDLELAGETSGKCFGS